MDDYKYERTFESSEFNLKIKFSFINHHLVCHKIYKNDVRILPKEMTEREKVFYRECYQNFVFYLVGKNCSVFYCDIY